jgi:DNA-binding GntR family transcriptional regulator
VLCCSCRYPAANSHAINVQRVLHSRRQMSKLQEPVIKRQTVTGSVAEELRRRIVSGKYVGGDQIKQEALASELGVSRIPIREALLQLEAEGLVVIHTHRGAMVASLTPEDAMDLFESRLAFEPVVLRKAIGAATPSDIERVGACLTEYEKAVKGGADPETLSRLNWAFHTAMCEPANRPRMVAILLSLYTATDRYLRLQIIRPEAKPRALKDHRALFAAYRDKNAALAGKLIKAHITGAYADVMAWLKPRHRAPDNQR